MIQSFDSSLAQELSAIREKLERLRIDRENTDEVLRQRGVMLDSHMKEILNRWEDQKQLEMEVDRLYRLKEIRLSCMVRFFFSPFSVVLLSYTSKLQLES